MDEGLAPLQGNEGCVEGAVKGGRSPAKRTLEGSLNADTLQGLGLVADFRSRPPSPSGGEDFPALLPFPTTRQQTVALWFVPGATRARCALAKLKALAVGAWRRRGTCW